LGGGLDGIAAGVDLRRQLGPGPEVVLVDRNPAFVMGLRKLCDFVGPAPVANGGPRAQAARAACNRVRPCAITSISYGVKSMWAAACRITNSVCFDIEISRRRSRLRLNLAGTWVYRFPAV
jgi:hypothetical protein